MEQRHFFHNPTQPTHQILDPNHFKRLLCRRGMTLGNLYYIVNVTIAVPQQY